MEWHEIVRRYVFGFTISSLRYFLFAGLLYALFYVWKKRDFFKYKIQQKYPDNKHILREIKYSLLSISVFAGVGTLMFTLTKMGYTKAYTDFNEHSVGYFILSVVVMILAHDVYFYFAHRFMHWKAIYPYVHKIHHQSTNPSPWAAFAFHPVEALLEVAIAPIMLFVLPLHPFAILAWLLFMTTMNVIGHLGFETFPKGFTKGTITKWLNTSTHHNMHHKYVTANYGLYFNVCDRLLGTNHKAYDTEFEMVKERTEKMSLEEQSNEEKNQTLLEQNI
jgi:lathosterol oxidase